MALEGNTMSSVSSYENYI